MTCVNELVNDFEVCKCTDADNQKFNILSDNNDNRLCEVERRHEQVSHIFSTWQLEKTIFCYIVGDYQERNGHIGKVVSSREIVECPTLRCNV